MASIEPVGNELTVNPLDAQREYVLIWSTVNSAREARIHSCGMLLR